jgi:hypothetical protein
MFSAAHAEILIRFYLIEKRVHYELRLASYGCACCNSQHGNQGSALLSASPVPHAVRYLLEKTLNAFTVAVPFWSSLW